MKNTTQDPSDRRDADRATESPTPVAPTIDAATMPDASASQERPASGVERDPVPRNDEPPAEIRTVETLLASFVLVLIGGALLIWAGSALFTDPQPGVEARDPWLPGVIGIFSLALGVLWMNSGFKKRRNARFESL